MTLKARGNRTSTSQPESSDLKHHVQKEEEMELSTPEAPDGGWGWIVVFCSFMIHVIMDGVTYTFGIFYMEFLKHFGESKGATSWIVSIMVGMTCSTGPFASGLTKQFGCRSITILGSILAAFGLLISAMAPNITFLYFSIGICTGMGFGLMYLPAIICVICYFEKKRSFAVGIAVSGSGIGTFVLAPVIQWMVSLLGWQSAMVITAGFVLNCCVFGALFRPLEPRKPVRKLTTCSFSNLQNNGDLRNVSLPSGTINSNDEIYIIPLKVENIEKQSSPLEIDNQIKHDYSNHQIPNVMSMTTLTCDTMSSQRLPVPRRSLPISNIRVNDLVEKERLKPSGTTKIMNCLCPATMREAFGEMMNFRLMKNILFLMFTLSNIFIDIGVNVPIVYTKDRTVSMGLAEEDFASYLLSIIGISNTIGRVIAGYLSDRSFVNRLWLYNSCLILCGTATACSFLCLNYNLMALYAAIFGVTSAGHVGLTSVILVDLLGLDKLTNAFGLLLLFKGMACLIGPPITGSLRDYTGSYDPGFYVSGGSLAFSGLMLFFLPCVQRSIKRDVRKKSQQVEIQLSPSHPDTHASNSRVKEQV